MKNRTHTLKILALLLSVTITNISARINLSGSPYEDSLCAYNWSKNHTGFVCICPSQWNDTIIDAPANITHLSKHGLKICLEDMVVTGSAEIVYLMDLSSSMNPGFGPTAGDPYKKRPAALYAACRYQIDSLKNSLAGYIGFHSFVEPGHCLKPVKVYTPAGISSLHAMVTVLQAWVDEKENNTTGYETNYRAPIDSAITWLTDPAVAHDTTRAIIIISDGEPDPGLGATAAQIQALRDKHIVVYGIFMGSQMGAALDSICMRTNGKSFLVPPSATDTVVKVVKSIAKTVIEPYSPDKITLVNNSNGGSAVSDSFTNISDTVCQAVFDKVLPLKTGINQVQVNAHYSAPSGKDTTFAFKFTYYVGGDTTYKSGCCYYCWYRTQMAVFVNDVPADTLSSQNNNYTLKFFYYGIDDTLTQVTILARTITKGDSETITMTNPVFDGKKWTFSKTVPFQIMSGNPVHNNGITESALQDEVTFYWKKTLEPLDTSFAKVAVVSPTFSSYSSLPLKNRPIKILQTKNSRGTVITVQFSTPVKNALVTLTAPNGRIVSACKGTDTRQIAVATTRFSNGVYFITVAAGQETITRKIILAQ